MCVDLSLGFLFCSIDLYVCLCASTILSWWLWLCSRTYSQAGWFLQFHSSFSRLLWLFEIFCISIQTMKLFILALWKLEHFLTPYTKINSKWIKDLNMRPETIKLLEENIGETLSDINHSRIIYDPPSQNIGNKSKNKWDLIKIKSFCTTRKI